MSYKPKHQLYLKREENKKENKERHRAHSYIAKVDGGVHVPPWQVYYLAAALHANLNTAGRNSAQTAIQYPPPGCFSAGSPEECDDVSNIINCPSLK